MCWQENKPHCTSVHHEIHIANVAVDQGFGSLTYIFKHRIEVRDVWAGWFKAGLPNIALSSFVFHTNVCKVCVMGNKKQNFVKYMLHQHWHVPPKKQQIVMEIFQMGGWVLNRKKIWKCYSLTQVRYNVLSSQSTRL